MTEMLPGFDVEAVKQPDAGLEAAARATIEALQADGVLTPRHALAAQLLVSISRSAGQGLQAGRTSIATTNLLRLAMDLLDKLPTTETEVSDEADKFLRLLLDAETAAKAAR